MKDKKAYMKTSDEPHDRLTEICAEMAEPLEQAGRENIRSIIMIQETDDAMVRNGIVIHGYSDESEAMVDLFFHLKAMFQSVGKDLQMMTTEGFIV